VKKIGPGEYEHKGWRITKDYDAWLVYVENDDDGEGDEEFDTLKEAQAHVRSKTRDDRHFGKEVRDLWRATYGRQRKKDKSRAS